MNWVKNPQDLGNHGIEGLAEAVTELKCWVDKTKLNPNLCELDDLKKILWDLHHSSMKIGKFACWREHELKHGSTTQKVVSCETSCNRVVRSPTLPCPKTEMVSCPVQNSCPTTTWKRNTSPCVQQVTSPVCTTSQCASPTGYLAGQYLRPRRRSSPCVQTVVQGTECAAPVSGTGCPLSRREQRRQSNINRCIPPAFGAGPYCGPGQGTTVYRQQ